MCSKFHQNRTINEEIDFWGIKGPGQGRRGGALFFKIERKNLPQNVGPNTDQKCPHSSSIRKRLKIGLPCDGSPFFAKVGSAIAR